MNIVKQRKSEGAICPYCRHPDYKYLGKEIKHEFQCNKCGQTWSAGRTKSKYTRLANNLKTQEI